MSDRSVDELIAAAAEHDSTALAQLYDLYSPVVYRVALGIMLSADEAEDVVHDVFIELSRTVRGYRGTGSFEGWLRRLAVRAALSRLRTERRRRRLRLVNADGTAIDPGTETLARLEVERLLCCLPPKLRAVVMLKDLEQVTHHEIAAALGISVAASKVRYHRAMRALRRHVREGKD